MTLGFSTFRQLTLASLLTLTCACEGNIGDEGDTSEQTTEDAMETPSEQPFRIGRWWRWRRDAAVPTEDASTPIKDAGGSTPVKDAGTMPIKDAGTPPVKDAGPVTPPKDAGTEPPTRDAGTEPPPSSGNADAVWSPLSVLKVVNPLDHGAVGDGRADDLKALQSAVNALPASGGVVYFPGGKSFKKNDLLIITKDHVKLWGENRQAEIYQAVNNVRRKQSILCRNDGCGVFGLKLRSDSQARFDALEDNQIAADHGSLLEVSGNEVEGSVGCAVFMYGSTEHYIDRNYMHHTWADHIHHTDGASASWVWENTIFNEAPSKGDDGIACVTYGPGSTRCRDMEWWSNRILHTGWGRGYSVIGGDDIEIHHNWAIGVAGAGVIIASESAYDSASSRGISVHDNAITRSGHTIGHPGILVSGENGGAEALRDITLRNNVSASNQNGPYRAEGAYANVVNDGMATSESALPGPMPSQSDAKMADTSVLRTRDVSHAPADKRAGLHRIHVRRAGAGFEQRFEYVVKGAESAVSALARAGFLVEQRTVEGTAYALVLTREPVSLTSGASGVTFRELREKDRAGQLDWLWKRIDEARY